MRIACKPGDRSIRTEDVIVAGRGGPIPARVYTRPDQRAGAPAILFIHGGGFIDGGRRLLPTTCSGLAARPAGRGVGFVSPSRPSTRSPPARRLRGRACAGMAALEARGFRRAAHRGGRRGARGEISTVALALRVATADGPADLPPVDLLPVHRHDLELDGLGHEDIPASARRGRVLMVDLRTQGHAEQPLVSLLHADSRGAAAVDASSLRPRPLRTTASGSPRR